MQKSTRNEPGTQQAQQHPPGRGDRLRFRNMYTRLYVKQGTNTDLLHSRDVCALALSCVRLFETPGTM